MAKEMCPCWRDHRPGENKPGGRECMLEPPRGFAKGISGGHDKMGKDGRRSRDEHGPEITDKGEP